MIGVQCQLMICRGHIRASEGALQIFLWLTVVWQIDILVEFCTFVFIFAAIGKGHKWVRRSNIISIVNLNMVYQIPVLKLEIYYLGANRSKKHVFFWV